MDTTDTTAKLRAWPEALAHAAGLLDRGEDVSIDHRALRIEFREHDSYRGGAYLRDPDDGTPAYQEFYPDGTPKSVIHYRHIARDVYAAIQTDLNPTINT